MTHKEVTLSLPQDVLSRAQVLATTRGVSIGDMVQQFLTDETTLYTRTRNRRAAETLGQLVPVFEHARDWHGLQAELKKRGFALRPTDTGLAIYGTADGKHLCDVGTVGHRYAKLVERFGAPMPPYDVQGTDQATYPNC